MNVLVIAPHPDDETLGCGGTIRLHAGRGDRVTAVFLTSGELGLKHLPREEAWRLREREAAAAAEILGIERLTFLRRRDWFVGEEVAEVAADVRAVLEREAPQLIYVPHEKDDHPDHRASRAVVRAALGGQALSSAAFLTYEIWTPLQEHDRVVDISSAMATKLRAVRCYGSQLAGFRYDRAVRGLNEYRGALAGRCRYAEVFQSIDVP